MRKALLVFALVAFLATGTVFAELTGVGEPTVSGSVSTTYGYDLDAEASGFYNDSSLTLTLPLLDGSMTKGAEDDMYGEITVDGIGWQLNNDGFYDVDEDADDTTTAELDASISAKLVIKDFFVELGNPDFEINNVDVNTDYEVDANTFLDDPDTWGHGATFGFANDMVTLGLKVASYNDGFYTNDKDSFVDYEDEATNPFDNDTSDADDDTYAGNLDNYYVFGADLTLTPMEGVSIPASFVYDANYTAADALIGIGAAPSISLAPLTFSLPVDYVAVGDVNGLEVMPELTYDLVEGGSNVSVNFLYGTYTDVMVLPLDAVYDDTGALVEDETGNPIVPGDYVAVDNAVAELGVSFVEDETNGFVPGLAATLDVALTDMMDYLGADEDMGWTVDGTASYNMNGLKPYMGAGYGDDEVLDLNVGVEMAAAFTGFDNTVFTLDYATDDLTDADTETYDNELGRVTFDVTVSF